MAAQQKSRRSGLPAPVQRVRDVNATSTLIETTFRVITPLHGGGVSGGTGHDSVTPVRGASIRGQLRFWWRAVFAHRFNTVEALSRAEAGLWGTGAREGCASRVAQWVTAPTELPTTVDLYERGNNTSWRTTDGWEGVAYLARAYVPKRGAPRVEPLIRLPGEYKISLRISGSSSWADQVNCALQAWLTFGGVGGRTRRGFGAVDGALTHRRPTQLLSELRSQEIDFEGTDGGSYAIPLVAQLPATSAGIAFGRQEFGFGAPDMDGVTPAERAWIEAANKLRHFRQGEGMGRVSRRDKPRDAPPNRPGRSYWPEPDQIRSLRGLTSDPQSKRASRGLPRKFPRAEFGMPIEFEFFGDRDVYYRVNNQTNTVRGDRVLDKHSLNPAGKDRMASPLVLRPRQSSAQDGVYKAMALQLHVPHLADVLSGLQLTDSLSGSVDVVDARLTPSEADRIRPMNTVGGPVGNSAVAAFLKYL